MESRAKVCVVYVCVSCDRRHWGSCSWLCVEFRYCAKAWQWRKLFDGFLEADVAIEGCDLWWPVVFACVRFSGVDLYQYASASFHDWHMAWHGSVCCPLDLLGLWALASGAHMFSVSIHVFGILLLQWYNRAPLAAHTTHPFTLIWLLLGLS